MTTKQMIDLNDLTFLIPVRIDSEYRKANLEVVVKVLARDFKTNIIVLEADTTKKFYPSTGNIEYHFVFDEDVVYHKTKYVNQLIKLADTPFIAVWDADAIGIPEQVFSTIDVLRNNIAVMAYPYDGRFYSVNKPLTRLFYQTTSCDILIENVPMMPLMHGYYSPGGAYLVNRDKYVQAGGENENFYGWGPEDAERIKRMEVLNLPVFYTEGIMFHLWHPRGKNGYFVNKEAENCNRREFLKTCAAKPVQQIFNF